jgi:hypothetical protein
MIAIVSSTVAPSVLPGHDGPRTNIAPEVRLEHTRATVDSLLAAGIKEIVIADNSPGDWLRQRVAQLQPARVLHFDQPPIRNKGLGEMWLLLAALEHLPPGEPILKISGRYRIGPASPLLAVPAHDVVARVYRGRQEEISTRAYVLRNREVAARLWPRMLDEIYAAQSRVRGPRSLLRLLRASLWPERDDFPYADPPLSVEIAGWRAIRHLGLSVHPVEHIAVEGTLGSWINPEVRE